MSTLCPAPRGLSAAFASPVPGPPEQDPIMIERVVVIHDGYEAVVVDDAADTSTGLCEATDFDGFLGLVWNDDRERVEELTRLAVEYRKENVPLTATPI